MPQQGKRLSEGIRASPSVQPGRMCVLACGVGCVGVGLEGRIPPLGGVEVWMAPTGLLTLDVLHLQIFPNVCHEPITLAFFFQPVTSFSQRPLKTFGSFKFGFRIPEYCLVDYDVHTQI
jgi:hypothetical protein